MATATKKNELLSSTGLIPVAFAVEAAIGLFIFLASDKGGVGKTFFFRYLVETLRKRKPGKVAAFDGDNGTGSGVRILGMRDANGELLPPDQQTAVDGVVTYNMRKSRTREEFINSISTSLPFIIHDQPGGAFDAMTEIADGGGESLTGILNAVADEKYQPIAIHAVHHEDESTESVARYLDATEGSPTVHIAVLNERDAESLSDFEMWFGYKDETTGEQIGGRTRDRLLATGGFEIVMPRLAGAASSRIKRYNLTFEQACTDKRLTLAQRIQVKNWFQTMNRNLTDTNAKTNPYHESASKFVALFGL